MAVPSSRRLCSDVVLALLVPRAMPCAARSRWRRRLRAGSLRGGSLAARWHSSTCTPRPTTSSSPPIATWPSGKWPGRSPCRCWSRQSPTDDGHHLLAADSHHTRTRTPHPKGATAQVLLKASGGAAGERGGLRHPLDRSVHAVCYISPISPLHLPYISTGASTLWARACASRATGARAEARRRGAGR